MNARVTLRALAASAAFSLAAIPCARAQTSAIDPAAARAQLIEGFDLKKQGRLQDALPHLRESVRLDPTNPKALLNLADCEEQLHLLAAAEEHWVQARDRAAEQSDDVVRAEAARRLRQLDARMPRLVVRLAPGAPADTTVTRDGVLLGAVSLGTPLPADPGKHTFVANASGHAGRSFEVVAREGTQTEVVVDPGPAEATAPTKAPADAKASADAGAVADQRRRPSSAWKTVGLVVAGTGAVALGVGAVFGVSAMSQQNAANCPDNRCGSSADASTLRSALSSAHVADVFLVAGGLLAAGGLALWLFAPSAATSPGMSVGFAGPALVVRRSW